MALHDEEQRQLAEIERRLAEDDPRLAERLAALRPAGFAGPMLTAACLVILFVFGLAVIAIGAEISSPVLGILGIVLAVVVPTVIVWRKWLRRLH